MLRASSANLLHRLLLVLFLAAVLSCWEGMPRDNGQYDRFADLLPDERRCPYSVLLDNQHFFDLNNAFDTFIQHPAPLTNLQNYACQQVPALNDLYNQFPDTPSLFHVDELLAKLPAHPNVNGPRTPIEIHQLACLKADPPGNVPPLSPHAPPGPTVNYAQERADFIEHVAPGAHIAHYMECFRVCVTPMLIARSQRLGLRNVCSPTQRMYEVARLIQSLELMSMILCHHVDIVRIVLHGSFAQTLALITPRPRRINLIDFRLASQFFGVYVYQAYHPRVLMSSAHVIVRSLTLLRERLYIDVDDFDTIAQALNLDLANVMATLDTVSRTLSDYISVHGTGTHGAGGAPPRYQDFGRHGGGGCSIKQKRRILVDKGLISVDADRVEVELTFALDHGDVAELRTTLEHSGCLVDVYTDSQIMEIYRNALPGIRLAAFVHNLGNPALDDCLVDNPALQQPSFVNRLLSLCDSHSHSHDSNVNLADELLQLFETADPSGSLSPRLEVTLVHPSPSRNEQNHERLSLAANAPTCTNCELPCATAPPVEPPFVLPHFPDNPVAGVDEAGAGFDMEVEMVCPATFIDASEESWTPPSSPPPLSAHLPSTPAMPEIGSAESWTPPSSPPPPDSRPDESTFALPATTSSHASENATFALLLSQLDPDIVNRILADPAILSVIPGFECASSLHSLTLNAAAHPALTSSTFSNGSNAVETYQGTLKNHWRSREDNKKYANAWTARHVVRDYEGARPMTDEVVRPLLGKMLGAAFLPLIKFVAMADDLVYPQICTLEIVFDSPASMFSFLETRKKAALAVLQEHNDRWAEKRKREGWW